MIRDYNRLSALEGGVYDVKDLLEVTFHSDQKVGNFMNSWSTVLSSCFDDVNERWRRVLLYKQL